MAADELGILIAVAVEREARAVLDAFGNAGAPASPWVAMPIRRSDEHRWQDDLLITGVGKANAAGAIARCADRRRHRGVLNVGVCGSMDPGVPVGACVAGTASVYADEGIAEPGGFRGLHEMGFPVLQGSEGSFAPDPAWLNELRELADVAGPIATVSTCSGTDAAAAAVRGRTGAIAEAMEGAAIAQTLERLGGFRFAELRTVSNFTGDRGAQAWDLDGAFSRLTEVLGRWRGFRV